MSTLPDRGAPIGADANDSLEAARAHDRLSRELLVYPMERVVSILLPLCQNAEHAVHVSCETGLLALMTGGHCPNLRLTGLDHNSFLLEVARENALLALWSGSPARTVFVESPANRFPLEDGSADVVFTFNALYRCPCPVTLLQECRRIARPGGRLLLYELVRDADPDKVRFVCRWLQGQQEAFLSMIQACYSSTQISGFLEEAGLQGWQASPDNLALRVTHRIAGPGQPPV